MRGEPSIDVGDVGHASARVYARHVLIRNMIDFKAPYTELEAKTYDRVIAPAVASFETVILEDALARIPRGGRLLEVGCGGGQLLAKIADRRADVSLVGLDLAPGQVARAKERTARFGGRVDAVEGSALELPFEDESFDGVLSVASIKHWPDPQRGLRECVRVLRPGAELHVVEANRGCRPEEVRDFVRRWKQPGFLWPISYALFRFAVADRSPDLYEAAAWIAEVGLEDVRAQPIEGTPGLLMSGRRTG